MATESNDALASPQKIFSENKSHPIQGTLVTSHVHNQPSNEECNIDVTGPGAAKSAESATDPSGSDVDEDHTSTDSDVTDTTDSEEGSPLIQPSISKKIKKTLGKIRARCSKLRCCLTVWLISIIIVILTSVVAIWRLEVYFNNQPEHYNNYTCTGAYLIIKKFDCYNENLCTQLSDINIEGVRPDNGPGDMAYIYLTECANIEYSHDQSEDCRMDCGLSHDSLKITSLMASNNTQKCTLCTLPKNAHTQPQCDQTCHFSISRSSKLLASSAGSGLCVLGMGVSNGAGECQRTQVSLKVDFLYTSVHRNIVRWFFGSLIVLGLILAMMTVSIIRLCHYCKKGKHSTQVESKRTGNAKILRSNHKIVKL